MFHKYWNKRLKVLCKNDIFKGAEVPFWKKQYTTGWLKKDSYKGIFPWVFNSTYFGKLLGMYAINLFYESEPPAPMA